MTNIYKQAQFDELKRAMRQAVDNDDMETAQKCAEYMRKDLKIMADAFEDILGEGLHVSYLDLIGEV
jgi:hypothetical protein